MANESTPIMLADVSCPKSTLLHLLRCDHNDLVNRHLRLQNGCDHTKDVVVYCGEFSSYNYSRNTIAGVASIMDMFKLKALEL